MHAISTLAVEVAHDGVVVPEAIDCIVQESHAIIEQTSSSVMSSTL